MKLIKLAVVGSGVVLLSSCGMVDKSVEKYQVYKKELSYESSVEFSH